MIKLKRPVAKISNEEAKQVFRQFAWALSGALQTGKPSRSKPQSPVRPRTRAGTVKRHQNRSAN